MKGDRVTVIVDLGAGYTRDETIEATLPGGRVAKDIRDESVTVTELGRVTKRNPDGALVREAVFRRSSVIAVIDQPARR